MYRFQGRDIREIVDRKDWQDIRKSLIGTWKYTPVQNVEKLERWLSEGKEELDRYIIIYNYLTGSGFRIGVISHPRISLLRNNVLQVLFQHKVFRARPISLDTEDNIGNNNKEESVPKRYRSGVEKQLIFGGI